MRFRTYITTILCFFLNSPLGFTAEKCDETPSLSNFRELARHLNDSASNACSMGAKSSKEDLEPITYGIFSAKGKMENLFQKLEGIQKKILEKTVLCPAGCSPILNPTIEIKTRPTASSPHEQCPDKYTAIKVDPDIIAKHSVRQRGNALIKTFSARGELKDCQDLASNFAQNILLAKEEPGQTIEKIHCPSPCTYSSSIKMRTLEVASGSCQVALELVVECGPPRKSMEWKTTASIEDGIRCEAKR